MPTIFGISGVSGGYEISIMEPKQMDIAFQVNRKSRLIYFVISNLGLHFS